MRTIEEKADVLVVGGGTAGVIAAIQSARAGAATMLVEMGPYLGGTLAHMGPDAAVAERVPDGIGGQLVSAALGLDGAAGYDKRERRRVGAQAYVLVAEEACLRAGISVVLHELAIDARRSHGVWRVRTVGKGVERMITAHEVVDSTADADVVGAAGFARMKSHRPRTGALAFRLGGYDSGLLDMHETERRCIEAVRAGVLQRDDVPCDSNSLVDFLRDGGEGCHRLRGVDVADSAAQTALDLEGRQHLLRLVRFVRRLPGCACAHVDYMAPRAALRETYRIAGETTVRYEDCISRRRFGDGVCYVASPREKGCVADGTDERGRQGRCFVNVPFGAMIPRDASGMLAAGRCVSCDEGAFPFLGAWGACMTTGQVVGAAAALGAVRGIPSRHIPVEDIRALLAEHGVPVL